MLTLLCRFGTVYPVGGPLLAAEVDNYPLAAKRLAAIPGLNLIQDGDSGKPFTFPVELFDQVATLLWPRKRRRLSEVGRQSLVAAGRRYRFGNGVESVFSGRRATAEPQGGV
jgi:hypothetical protein